MDLYEQICEGQLHVLWSKLLVSPFISPIVVPYIRGTPAVPFYPFCLGVSLLKLNSRKKGTLMIRGLLGNLV